VLACLLSWGWLIPIAAMGGVVVAGKGWPTHFPALLGPLLAAFVITGLRTGRAGVGDLVRRMARLRVPARWWLFAGSPLLLLLITVTVGAVLARRVPALEDFAQLSGLPSEWGVWGVAVAVLLVNGFGEETGWRGYAVPVLQRRYSPLTATLVVALMWAVWHVPMFVVVASFRSFGPALLVGWLIGLGCGAIVLTWLYNRSGGSILLVAVWHTGYNLVSGTAAGSGLLAAISTTAVIVLATALVALEVRATRTGSPSVIGP
jgi:membrane protease YdiL (CAAX protease family)